ncbi:helix-turn-helix domain-containing protein [Actinoallomurus soli]|uniref:helix-turn-helix domain-containing protein n=1 Tax=Actinoallomurus soli TaxID=2952535 RepID=UPI002092DCA9|nr:helix-turn-helix domain-containing protein [Actinoallomurus soli]MCO5971174.1 helix-turn-helix domain-containing protein [Actinoallomurus soli]
MRDDSSEESLAERLARLEERVARLEGAPPADTTGAPAESGALWALEGLKDRAPAPGAVLFTGAVDLPTGEHYEWQEGRTAEDLLTADWTQGAAVLAALAHPVRLLLLREILLGTRTTAELGEHEQLGTSGQLYHHLRQLVAAGWLRAEGRGEYAVPAGRVVPLLALLLAARR